MEPSTTQHDIGTGTATQPKLTGTTATQPKLTGATEPKLTGTTIFLGMTFDAELSKLLSGTIRGKSKEQLLKVTSYQNENPHRDTARMMHFRESLQDHNLVAVSLVDSVAESREFVKLNFVN